MAEKVNQTKGEDSYFATGLVLAIVAPIFIYARSKLKQQDYDRLERAKLYKAAKIMQDDYHSYKCQLQDQTTNQFLDENSTNAATIQTENDHQMQNMRVESPLNARGLFNNPPALSQSQHAQNVNNRYRSQP